MAIVCSSCSCLLTAAGFFAVSPASTAVLGKAFLPRGPVHLPARTICSQWSMLLARQAVGSTDAFPLRVPQPAWSLAQPHLVVSSACRAGLRRRKRACAILRYLLDLVACPRAFDLGPNRPRPPPSPLFSSGAGLKPRAEGCHSSSFLWRTGLNLSSRRSTGAAGATGAADAGLSLPSLRAATWSRAFWSWLSFFCSR